MVMTASTDRIFQVHRELGKILDDLGMAGRLPQVLLDRLNAVQGTLLQELNASSAADAMHEWRTSAPATTVPDSEHADAEQNALLRLDDDGGANSIAESCPV